MIERRSEQHSVFAIGRLQTWLLVATARDFVAYYRYQRFVLFVRRTKQPNATEMRQLRVVPLLVYFVIALLSQPQPVHAEVQCGTVGSTFTLTTSLISQLNSFGCTTLLG
jgi:hypothetical protein